LNVRSRAAKRICFPLAFVAHPINSDVRKLNKGYGSIPNSDVLRVVLLKSVV